jgi:hypothetical protein
MNSFKKQLKKRETQTQELLLNKETFNQVS